MEDFFRNIAEQKIRQAIINRDYNNLPGTGKPVKIENLYFLPPEFKFAYTVVKNLGYLNIADDKKTPIALD